MEKRRQRKMERNTNLSDFKLMLQLFGEDSEEDKDKDDELKDDEKDTEPKDDNEDEKPDEGKTFSQAEVAKLAAKEKKQGRSSALKDLGLDPNDKDLIEKAKAIIAQIKGKKTEGSDNSTQASDAEKRALAAETKLEVIKLGILPDYVDDVVTLALSKMTEDDELADVIEVIKTKYPHFTEEGSQGTKKKGTGNVANKKSTHQPKSIGERLATQKASSVVKKSNYWGN